MSGVRQKERFSLGALCPSEIVFEDLTPVEHPEGARFNGARGVNLRVNGAPRVGMFASLRSRGSGSPLRFGPEERDLRFASTCHPPTILELVWGI